MAGQIVVIVQKDKAKEVEEAVLNNVSGSSVSNDLTAFIFKIDGKNIPEAIIVAMAAGASSAFPI